MNESRPPRLNTIAKWSAVPIGLVLSAALVWQASYSAFSATTTNPTNNWSTGTIVLVDDDTNTAVFNATVLGTWAPDRGLVAKTYRINYTIDPAITNTQQGSTASIGLTWESQNS